MSLVSACLLASHAAGMAEVPAYATAAECNAPDNCVLSGKIVDNQTDEGISFASIGVKGTNRYAVTDAEGKYTLTLPKGAYELVVRASDYMEQHVPVNLEGSEMSVDVSLASSVFNLDDVVITGTRTEKTIVNSPVLTRLITAAQLQRNDFENIMDALQFNIPGMQFNSDPRGDNIKIQGLENDYILILVDGERLSTTPGGPIDFERMSTSNIRQIEVIKGAGSALYGSSAIGMIVNIITKTPLRQTEGWVKARYSRFNDLLIDGSFGTCYKNLSSQTLFNRNSTDGYDLTPESPEAYTKQPQANMTFEERLVWTRRGTKISAAGTLYFNNVKNPPLSTKNTHYRSHNITARAGLEQQLGKFNNLKFNYYGDFYTRSTVFERLDSVGKNATCDIQTLRLTDVYTPLENLQWVGGTEFNWIRNYNIMQYGEDQKIRKMNDFNAFVQGDWELPYNWEVVAGLRYTHHSVFGNAFTPKLNLMYSPGNLKLRAGYSRGFKAPDATELYSDFMMGSVSHNIGNPNLKAEHSNYFSLSAEYMFRNFNISAEIYQNSINDKIQSAYVNVIDADGVMSTEMRYSNVDKVRIRGVEISADYYPIRQVYLHASYAYTDALNRKTGLQLRGNTKHSLSCNGSWRFKVLGHEGSLAMSGHWCSRKINDTEETKRDDATGETSTVVTTSTQPAYSIWKLTLQYTPWRHKHMALTATAGVDNLFNYKDNVTYTTYDPGARVFGSVLFTF